MHALSLISFTKGTIYTLAPLETVNLGVDLAIFESCQAFRVTFGAIVDLLVNEKYLACLRDYYCAAIIRCHIHPHVCQSQQEHD